MSVDYRLIGGRIKAKRKAAGQTQEQLAEQLSVTVGYISQVERGATKISLDTLSEISSILDCDLSAFITGTATDQSSYMQEELLKKYSQLNQVQKRMLLEFVDVFLKNQDE